MEDLFRRMKEQMASGKDVVLVTVTAGRGSVPRGAGARMLVGRQGRICGTIGGGAIEYLAIQRSTEALEHRTSYIERFRLHENEIRDIGMVCGGCVDVHFQYISSENKKMMLLLDAVSEAFSCRRETWIIQRLEKEGSGAVALYGKQGIIAGEAAPEAVLESLGEKPCVCAWEGTVYYCEKLFLPGIVYIFGGGHVAQALVPVLASVDFRCVVLEDREEFCRKELFPQAEEVRMICNDRIADYVNIEDVDYVCVMTRGHKDDALIQAQVLRTPAAYVGVIGSRRKAAAVAERLRKEWEIAEEDIRRIHTPIGLEIGAETPAEIAVSIAAELIRCRAGME